MSGLEKELPEIPLPKPKKKVKTKARQSAKQAIARTRKKVAKAEQSLRSAKAHAKNVKDKLLTIDKVLDGKEQQLITQDVIDEAVSYTHLRAHETLRYLVCRLLLEKKKI